MRKNITQEELDNLKRVYFRINFDGHNLGTVGLDTSEFSDLEKIKLLDRFSELEDAEVLEEIE